jgi:hypothetical protein
MNITRVEHTYPIVRTYQRVGVYEYTPTPFHMFVLSQIKKIMDLQFLIDIDREVQQQHSPLRERRKKRQAPSSPEVETEEEEPQPFVKDKKYIECPICLTSENNIIYLCLHTCGHVVCEPCQKSWALEHTNGRKCALCKRNYIVATKLNV